MNHQIVFTEKIYTGNFFTCVTKSPLQGRGRGSLSQWITPILQAQCHNFHRRQTFFEESSFVVLFLAQKQCHALFVFLTDTGRHFWSIWLCLVSRTLVCLVTWLQVNDVLEVKSWKSAVMAPARGIWSSLLFVQFLLQFEILHMGPLGCNLVWTKMPMTFAKFLINRIIPST